MPTDSHLNAHRPLPLRRLLASPLAFLAALLASGSLFCAGALAAGPPQITATTFSAVTASSATLEATLNPNGAITTYHFEYVDQATFEASGFAEANATPDGEPLTGSEDTTVSATIAGLAPATAYRFRLFAHNSKSPAEGTFGEAVAFATYPTGIAGLPDNRAYEQASPVDKNGGDAIGIVPQVKAAPEGGAITFSSTSGIPGGVGAQEMPLFLARRSPSGWSSEGLLPPPAAGQQVAVVGWLPDFSSVFSSAIRLGEPNTASLVAKPAGGGTAYEALTPYLHVPGYSFIGSAREGAEIAFESEASLGSSPAGVAGVSNVYVLERGSGVVSLAAVDNEGDPMPEGAFGGSYAWASGSNAASLSQGGAAANYYSQDQHALAADGAIYFTEAGTGQLYLRRNPTEPQSAMEGERCLEPEKACTVHVSASRRTPHDPGGATPAAFVGAAADGSAAFFTSPEKLTDDANTGPEQPEPKIGRSDLDGSGPVPGFLAGKRAVGLATDSEHLYWADPVGGAIGRAELDGGNPEDKFIVPGPTAVGGEEVASRPRYVAVEGARICWTNTADGNNDHGTIGCATINPVSEEAEGVEPECVTGASNPQGIALNASYVYWANAGGSIGIGRAEIDCENPNQAFRKLSNVAEVPYGVGLSATKLYWTAVENNTNFSYISRAPLDGVGSEEFQGLGNSNRRGIAVAGEDVYWASQGDKAIGHAVWPDAEPKPTVLEKELVELEGAPSGIAVDSEHLWWSTDGETLPNPGNDLYRFDPNEEGGGTLTDLTPDAADENGAEVQGVAAISRDGSHVYFAANADLDGAGPAQAGDCKGPLSNAKGHCSLYEWNEGAISLVARVGVDGADGKTDLMNWLPATTGVFSGSAIQKTAFLSADGATLLFRSQEQLTAYDNKGISQLYRYREGEPLRCVSCNPTGAGPGTVLLDSIKPSTLTGSAPAPLASRNLSADGNRVFFETGAALVEADTNGDEGCPRAGSALQGFLACQDVYEWEAPGAGSCSESSPSYSPPNGGCLYLISTGKDDYPSFFADASADGSDVFLFTRQGLVGQDQDQLLDVYDARVGGGLPSQNEPPPPPPCEAEACKPAVTSPPALVGPATPSFQGPGNPVPKRPRCPKGKRAVKRNGKTRCVKKAHRHHRKIHRRNRQDGRPRR